MLVPLYGFVEGDTMGVLVLAHESWTIAETGERLRQSVRLRVGDGGEWELHAGGRLLAADATVASAGLRALDRVDLRRVGDR